MSGLPRQQDQRLASPVRRRWLWMLMAAIHAPALVSSMRGLLESGLDSGRLGGFAGLSLAIAFFVLKIWGVRFLEFGTHRRALLTVAVAVVLLHADAIGAYLDCEAVPKAIPVAATSLFAASLASVQRAAGAAFSRAARPAKRRHLLMPALESAWSRWFTPYQIVFAARLCTPRAPPA